MSQESGKQFDIKNKNPEVSVIIPVFNTGEYLAETIKSIQEQSICDIEIITIDDGSTDESLSIIKRLASQDKRIKVLSIEHQGQSSARNKGIEEACGKYIYFMDSDDLLEKDALEKCFFKCEKDNLDFVLFDGESFGNQEANLPWFDYRRAKYLEDKTYNGKQALISLLNIKKYRCSVCLHFIRHDFIKELKLRFYPGIIHEDELFSAIIYLKARRVGKIEETFFKRRIRSNSTMTSNFSSKNMEGYFTVTEQLKIFSLKEDSQTRKLSNKLIGYLLNNVLANAWELSWRERIKIFFKILRRYPLSVSPLNSFKLLFKKPLKVLLKKK